MRIDRLGLLAYGPFSDLVLDFSSGEYGLHVVHGPNEAGKSSALRALHAGLFKIPEQTTDNFRHAHSALKLLLELRSSRGETLSFVRRKKRKDPLSTPDDSGVVDEADLNRMLAGLGPEDFERIFGLDHESLRRGSDALLEPEGGADAALVGAALGLKDLKTIGDAIRAEATELFAARGRVKVINEAISELKNLQAQMKSLSLSERDWAAARKARDAAETELGELRAEAARNAVELEGLRFAQRNRGRILAAEDDRRRLEEVGAKLDLPEDFAKRHDEAREARLRHEVALESEEKRLEAKREELASCASRDTILDHETEIASLRDRWVALERSSETETSLQKKHEERRGDIEALAARLGETLPLSAEARRRLQLVAQAKAELGRLREERVRLQADQRNAQRQVESANKKLTRAEEIRAELPETDDSVDLGQAVKAAERLLHLEEGLAAQAAASRELEEKLSAELEGLPGPTRPLAELPGLNIPAEATVDGYLQDFAGFEDEARLERQNRARVLAELRRLNDQEARLVVDGQLPSLDLLEETRSRRDEQWRLVKRAWLEQADVREDARALDDTLELEEAFPASVQKSDDIADRLRLDSKRVAELQSLRLERDRYEAELDALEGEATERRTRLEAVKEAWAALWRDVLPLQESAPAMRDLGRKLSQLKSDEAELRRARNALVADTEKRDGALAALTMHLRSAGETEARLASCRSLSAALDLAERRQEELERRRSEKQRIDEEIRGLRAALEDADTAVDEAATDLASWSAELEKLMKRLGFTETKAEGEGLDRLDDWALLASGYADFEEASDGLSRRQSERDELKNEAAELARRFLGDEAPDGLDRRIQELVAKATRASLAAQEQARLEKEVAAQEERRTEVANALELSRRKLQQLAGEGGIEDQTLFPALIQVAQLKRALNHEGCPLEEARERIEATRDLDLDHEIANRESRGKTLAAEIDQKSSIFTLAQKQMDDYDREAGAHELRQQMAGLEAKIREESQRYLKLAMTGQLLSLAQNRFRSRHEAPTLAHASRHLQALTEGRYERIDVDLDDKDRAFFLLREQGRDEAKTLDQLSDGTRDQLHLALVLGSLEHRFEAGGEPMPLILDDVLVHFDDRRSRAALATLAEFSKKTQVLLFSHHERIAEQARALNRPESVFVQDLA